MSSTRLEGGPDGELGKGAGDCPEDASAEIEMIRRVGYLRGRFARFDIDPVETVRGIGYRYRPEVPATAV